jgi:tetratricopeptide (TPR) repeat protein
MRSSDYLFRLIKAMSKGDRRNFKLFARLQDGDKQYIRLFDAIDKQTEYDEEKLLKQFEGEKFTNQFSVAKNYLYNFILKTLHIFRKDPKTELNAVLHQVQILMSKNLFEQAQKLLRKAKHMAERQERFPELLFILETERLLLRSREQSKEFEAFIQQIQKAEEDTVAKIANLHEYNHIHDEIFRMAKRSLSVRDPELKSRLGVILSNPIIQDENRVLSVRAKLRRYDVLVGSHRLRGEQVETLENLKQLIAAYESNEDIRKEKCLDYINAVHNLGIAYYRVGQKEESFQALKKLRNIPVESEEAEIHVFEKYFQHKLALCIEDGALDEGREAIADFEREYPQREGTIMKSVELSIFYLISYFYIYSGEPGKGLDWVNRILNEPRTELRTDIQAIARIMNLIIHYHLGNMEFLEYEIKSVTRFLTNRERLFHYERTILKYVRQLATLGPDSNRETVLHDFKNEIHKVIQDKDEKQGMALFDIVQWVDAELERTTMWHIELASRATIRPPQ